MNKHSSATTLTRIVSAARQEFAEHGFDGARLDAVAREAGVTKQLVYHYFKTKDELYGLVLDRVAEEIPMLLDDPDYESMAPEQAIRRFIEHMVEAFVDRPYMVAMTLDQGLHRGEHLTRRSLYVPTIQRFVAERIAPILERGRAAGTFRDGLDPHMVYWSAFALATAVFTQGWVMSRSTGTDFEEREGIARWQEHVVAFTLSALAPPAAQDALPA